MTPLASTIFSTGPSDDLATVDVYNTSGIAPINSVKDQKTASSFDVSKLLANGGQGSIGSAGSLLKLDKTGSIGLNSKTLTDRLLKAAPTMASSLRGLSPTTTSNMTSSFQSFGTMDVKFSDGQSFNIDNKNYLDASAYGNYVNDYNSYNTSLYAAADPNSMSCSIYDIDSHASLISSGITQGSNLGIPKSYGLMTSNPNISSNTPLLTRVVSSALPILAKNGDLGNMAQMAQGPGGQVFGAVYPQYGNVIKQNYSYTNYGKNTGAQVNDYANLISVFTATDSSWNIFDRIGDATGTTGTSTMNLLKIIGGSREFTELIAIGVKSLVDSSQDKFQILGGMFSQTTVDDDIRLFFPKCYQESFAQRNVTPKNNVIDPRVLSLVTKIATQPNLGTIGI